MTRAILRVNPALLTRSGILHIEQKRAAVRAIQMKEAGYSCHSAVSQDTLARRSNIVAEHDLPIAALHTRTPPGMGFRHK